MNDLMTVKDVATKLQISPQSVYQIVNSGQLPAKRIGKSMLRFTESDILEYLERVQIGGQR